MADTIAYTHSYVSHCYSCRVYVFGKVLILFTRCNMLTHSPLGVPPTVTQAIGGAALVPGLWTRPVCAMLMAGSAGGCWAQIRCFGQTPPDLLVPDAKVLGDPIGGPGVGLMLAAFCFLFASGAGRYSIDGARQAHRVSQGHNPKP